MSSVNSATEKSHEEVVTQEKGHYKIVQSRDADVTLKFQEEWDAQIPEITPEQELKLSRKVSWFIITFTATVNLILYMDKATLSYAAILGLFEDTNLTNQNYNNANTLFYVGFIIGQVPGIYLLQKLPIGRFLFALTSIWTVIIFLSCLMKNYSGVIAVRFFLGFVESVVVPILNSTMAQFLTAEEKAAAAPLFYTTCLGVTIPTGFIAYGVLYANSAVSAWKIFMIIIGGLTFIMSILIFFFYPDNPTTAKFFSTEEKIWIIRRVQRTTNTAIEQKYFKKYQFIEAVRDPITWLFFAFHFLLMLANNLPYQQTLLFGEMGGISNLDSTLVSVASGGFAVICCLISSFVMTKFPNTSAFSAIFWMLPSLIGAICAVALPWSNKIGILAALCLASPVFGIPYIIMFSWNTTSCSGYTKKMTRNASVMIALGIGNLISPQLWQESDAPRYVPAWIVQIVLSFGISPLIAFVIWFILKRRNEERLKEMDKLDKVGIIREDEKEVVVNIASLDLTDLENRTFLYPL
jgi:MFS family permease